MDHRIVTAFYPTRAAAHAALDALARGGIPREAVLTMPKHVTHLDEIGLTRSSKAARCAAWGGAIFAALFGSVGAAFASGVIVAPGVGSVVAGRFVAALAGVGLGALVGGVSGALVGAARPSYEAAYLEDAIGRGGALVAVRCGEHGAHRVREILESAGAHAVDTMRARSALDEIASALG